MTDVTYEQFLPFVVQYVPGVADPVALHAIRNATIEFLDQSGWLLFEHDPITVLEGIGNYEYEPPSGNVQARIESMWIDGRPLLPMTQEQLDNAYTWQDWRDAEGTPLTYTQLTGTEFILVPKPLVRARNAIKLILTLKPTRASVGVDETVYEKWAEEIGQGARARLHETPGQQFYDPATAMKLRANFLAGITRAKIDRNRNFNRTGLRVQMPRFV